MHRQCRRLEAGIMLLAAPLHCHLQDALTAAEATMWLTCRYAEPAELCMWR